MVFFSKIGRSKSVTDRYASQPETVYGSSNPAHRPTLHQQGSRQRFDSGQTPLKVSYESIPHLVYENARGGSSDVSLPDAYTNVEIDTSRYPKMPTSVPGAPQRLGTHRRKPEMPQEVYHQYERSNEARLAPMLAVESVSVMWDVRDSPAHMRQSRNTRQVDDVAAPATSTQAQRMRLVSLDFPWTIEVSKNSNRPLTVLDIIEALYEGLGKELRRSEWALAPDGQKYTIQKANRHRRGSETAKRIRRVDWLGSRTMFRGLEKDESLARKRSMPGDESQGEMWAVRFGSQR